MASKIFGEKRFELTTSEGQKLIISAWTYEHAKGWGHRAEIAWIGDDYVGFQKRHTYYNRTWERFQYETVIKETIKAFFSGKKKSFERAFLLKQIEDIADAKAEKAEKWLRDFREVWERVPEWIKENIRKQQTEIKSDQEADYFLATLRLLAA